MIPQIFKKKQESFNPFCQCILPSNSGILSSNGEKFLIRPQVESIRNKPPLNKTTKNIENRNQRGTKLSLKTRQNKTKSIQNRRQRCVTRHQEQKSESNQASNSYLQLPCNYAQNSNAIRVKGYQQNQYTFLHQKALRQELSQLKIDCNQQNYLKRVNTEKSTVMSNQTQPKNSPQMMPIRKQSIKSQGKDNVSIFSNLQQANSLANSLAISQALSSNFILRNIIADSSEFMNQETITVNQNYFRNESKELSFIASYKLTDIAFKSAQSISDVSSDQFSELASNNQQRSDININQDSWSTSLNQIFAKKVRRPSHHPVA